ncbi:MAG TPA: alpha/beta hydrolase [Chthoniobacteraceae bacterium]|jgi:pimeloyl-ACP methyl ester carboxylesterase|nr:alpha/beta hydrolase [Chthoniobacteraceae bacterium]
MLQETDFARLADLLRRQEAVTNLEQDVWMECRRFLFSYHGRESFLVLPETPHPLRPWLWRPTFFGAWPETDLRLIRKGFHLAYTDVLDFYASPAGVEHGHHFHALLRKIGMAAKFAFIALSRGGLFAYRYAEAFPEQVAVIYADAPVCDVRSWPGGLGVAQRAVPEFQQLLAAHGISEADALKESFQPIYRLESLASHGIPLIHVGGDADDVVPFQENTLPLAREYRALGGHIQVIVKPGIKHHPHCLDDPEPVVRFIEKYTLEDPS